MQTTDQNKAQTSLDTDLLPAIDQNRALTSLDTALLPKHFRIDERTDIDYLDFLVNFASVINFYDNNNVRDNDWQPFLLKDPVFLLASISKMRYPELYAKYQHTCQKLDKLFQKEKKEKKEKKDTKDTEKEIWNTIGLLIEQFIFIFKEVEQWTYYMLNTPRKYDLKKYVLREIKDNYSPYFWALIELRQQLYTSGDIRPTAPKIYNEFGGYDEKVWQQGKNVGPYWKVLGLDEDVTGDEPDNIFLILKKNPNDIYLALTNVGDLLFDFLKQSVNYAKDEFRSERKKRGNFPDTVLLRSFTELLGIYRKQLNGLTKKHLHFYFKDILKQRPLKAIPDQAFISTTLAKGVTDYEVPKGTQFNAGINAQKDPIIFESLVDTGLNSAKISNVYTLSASQDKDGFTKLSLVNVPDTGKIKQDEDGLIQSWATFGGGNPDDKNTSLMGVAFASPMLYLLEGNREVTLTLTFSAPIDLKTFDGAQYFLSTEKDWLEITKKDDGLDLSPSTDSNKVVTISFTLDATVAAITPFTKNPDDYESSWPLFKLVFSKFLDVANPPVLESLQIDVEVCQVKTFELSNDNGSVSTKKPYPLFGNTPSLNSSFIIGTNEIFSKPYNYFTLKLDWDKLPDDKKFSTYYSQYNDYINKDYDTVTVKKEHNLLGDILKPIIGLFSSSSSDNGTSNETFSNTAFTVDFFLLEEGIWSAVTPDIAKQTCDFNNGCIQGCKDYVEDTECAKNTDNHVVSNLLFSTDGTNCELITTSYFTYDSSSTVPLDASGIDTNTTNPYLQNSTLKYSDTSTEGFLKMSLTGPPYGFGNDIYAKVVSAVSLVNAAGITNSKGGKVKLIPAPNVPFIPQVSSLTAKYRASCIYTFDSPPLDGYPIQCFTYSPFENYLSYDNVTTGFVANIDASLTSSHQETKGISLYPAFSYEGSLFLGLTDLTAPNELNFYFELAQNYTKLGSNEMEAIDYTYLSSEGWKKLKVLSDGTNQFSCSGILNTNIMSDIVSDGVVMPANTYWLSLSVNEIQAYAHTTLLQPNGLEVTRIGTSFLKDKTAPVLASDTITKPMTAIPEISSIAQPFPSFGGKGAENKKAMNQRVSHRLKSKNRCITSEDYFRSILGEFPEVYFVKTLFDSTTKITQILVVKECASYDLSHAFIPLISSCMEQELATFLKPRVLPFTNIDVSSFSLEFVTVSVHVTLANNLSFNKLKKEINLGLNIFLSPWIDTDQSQIPIDSNISASQVAQYVQGFDGVEEATQVTFTTYLLDDNGKQQVISEGDSIAKPNNNNSSILLVTSGKHEISCNNCNSGT